MVRDSAWKKTKAYIRRMRGNRAGGWIALLLLFLVEIQCVTSTETVSTERIQYRLPLNVIPMSYDVKVTPFVDEGNFTFNGETKIMIKVLNETSNITLHAYYDLEINENMTSLVDADGKSMKPMHHNRENETDFLTLNFEQFLKPGNYSLNFKFTGNISNEPFGIYKASYINVKEEKIWLVLTRFTPTAARRAFPCWDEPALKATFNISIKHFSNYTVTSNMPMKNQIDAGSGKKWTIFNTTPIMSTRTVAFIISDFQCISNAKKTINTCTHKEAMPKIKMLQHFIGKAIPLLEEYTKIPYSLPKLDNYVIPQTNFGGISNWGLINYPAYHVITGSSNCAKKNDVIGITLQELARQWFGNLVTPAWWNDIWLETGLARYMQFHIADEIFPDRDIMNIFVATNLQIIAFSIESFKSEKFLNWEPNSPAEIKSQLSTLIYEKGPIIIHMLSHIIGKPNLREGIRLYLKQHQYGVVTSDDFWSAVQQAYNSDEIKIKEVMDTWIEQSGYPIVTATRDYEAGTAIVTQSPNLPSEKSDKWYIPINFATESEPSCTCTLPTHWLAPKDTSVTIEELKKDDWLIINLKQSGYYRVDYDETNWLKIADYLNNDNFTSIHVLNRAQIMNDLLYMVVNDRQNLTTFLEVIKYLSREDDYIPWSQAVDSFSSLKIKIEDKRFFDNIEKYALHMMKKVINKVGFEERPTDTYVMKLLRSKILRNACAYGHIQCRQIAENKLAAFLENPEENQISPNLENWVWISGAEGEKAKILLEKKIESGTYEYMRYLNVPKTQTFYRDFIEIAMANSSIPKNATRVAFGQLKNGDIENWDYTVDYFIKNFERIYKYFNDPGMALSILNDCIWVTPTLDRMKKINDFVDENTELMPSWIKTTITEQTKKLKWSEIHVPTFNYWLEKELMKTTLID